MNDTDRALEAIESEDFTMEACPTIYGATLSQLKALAAEVRRLREEVEEYEAAIKACHGLTTQYGTLVPQEFFEIRFIEAGTSKGYWLVYNSFAEIISPDCFTALEAWRWLKENRTKFVHGEGFMGPHLKDIEQEQTTESQTPSSIQREIEAGK